MRLRAGLAGDGGRRAASRANDERRALRRGLQIVQAARIAKRPRTDDGDCLRTGGERARYAGRAVQRLLQMADEIVVFEGRREDEEQMEADADVPKPPQPAGFAHRGHVTR
jgi:hypothetical protein